MAESDAGAARPAVSVMHQPKQTKGRGKRRKGYLFLFLFFRTNVSVGFSENQNPENKSLIIIFPEHLYCIANTPPAIVNPPGGGGAPPHTHTHARTRIKTDTGGRGEHPGRRLHWRQAAHSRLL